MPLGVNEAIGVVMCLLVGVVGCASAGQSEAGTREAAATPVATTHAGTSPTTIAAAEVPRSELSTTSRSTELPTTDVASAAVETPPTTTPPTTTPPTTTSPTTGIPAPPPTPAASATAAPVPCNMADGMVTTPGGRRVLLRAAHLTGPAPLVVVIHGYTGTPSGIERYSDMTRAAVSAGVAVAYPEGTPTPHGGYAWTTGATTFANQGVDDVGALGEMLDAVIATGCVDAERVILTGESNGGGLTVVAICDPRLAARVRSAVAVIPAIEDGVLARCADRPSVVPLSVVAGRLDRTVPFDGGRAPLLAQEDWWGRYARDVNGCARTSDLTTVVPHVEEATGTGCVLCTSFLAIDDGEHTWPGAPQGVAGLHPGTFSLNERVVEVAQSGEGRCLSAG